MSTRSACSSVSSRRSVEKFWRGGKRVGAEPFFSFVGAGAAGLEGKGGTDEFMDEGSGSWKLRLEAVGDAEHLLSFVPNDPRYREL